MSYKYNKSREFLKIFSYLCFIKNQNSKSFNKGEDKLSYINFLNTQYRVESGVAKKITGLIKFLRLIFYWIYTIHVLINNDTIIPTLYALLPNKTQDIFFTL